MEINVSNVLAILRECSRPVNALIESGLNYTDFVREAIELRIENPDYFKKAYSDAVLWELLTSDPETNNTSEAWSRYSKQIARLWDKHINIFQSLFEYEAPSYKKEDTTIEWLLEEVYGGRKFQDLEQEEINKIAKFYDNDSYPAVLAEYMHEQGFQDWLENFDTAYEQVDETYTITKCNTFDIKEALKNVVINRKISNPIILNTFFSVVDWYAPTKNPFGPNYRKEYILEIFQVDDNSGIPMWSEDMFQMIKDHYYDIDFDDCFEMVREQNQNRIREEADYISEKLKQNPNYRHD
mgnify:CR=1 FL=1